MLALCAASGMRMRQHQRADDAHLLTVEREQTRLREEIRRATESAETSERLVAELAAKIAKLPAKPVVAPMASRSQSPTLVEFMEKSPELTRLWRQRTRAGERLTYGAMFVTHGFSSEEIERFGDILNEHNLRSEDIWRAAAAHNVTHGDPVLETLRKEEDARYRESLTAALGAVRAQEIREYDRKIRPRQLTDGLAASVAFTAPLTREQADRFTQIIAEATPSYVEGGDADSRKVDWAQVDAKARMILTPAQFTAWKNEDSRYPNRFPGRSELMLVDIYERAVEAQKKELAIMGKSSAK